jgi:hypothetical protein
LRIIDFTAFWAGPFATWYLAATGADVIKIESIQRPDGMRFQSVRPPTDDALWEWGALFHIVNVGKRGITLDLTAPAAQHRQGLRRRRPVGNFSPRVMNSPLLWQPRRARPRGPRSVWCAPAFGLDLVWRDRVKLRPDNGAGVEVA